MIYANGAYTYRKLVYENTRAQVYTIMAKVEDLPGYVEGETPVVFSGDFTDSNFTYHNDLIRLYEEGETGLSGSAITYDGTHQVVVRQYHGQQRQGGQHTGGTGCLGRKSCCAGHAQLPRQRLHCHGGWCGCN